MRLAVCGEGRQRFVVEFFSIEFLKKVAVAEIAKHT